MIIVNIGCMYVLNIAMNPISLVNLIMFIGINMEFLCHMARNYLHENRRNRREKAFYSAVKTSSTIIRGIVLTKLIGIVVLAFSSSILFKVYYFQMYACAIMVGALHGLILLPVLLSYLGPFNLSSRGSMLTLPIQE
ncbi:Niemann-Pick C1 protein [Thelohanellus kitauei]|uniref:Niemann-Pick C1 protein n=1 Tax=Thelohanellus kitauei TaxID=669202 RepID=A0A0C2MNI5_THEKT|nr:Niemann-Pick C1 protein [Thelohanellus kitauei]